MDGDIILYSVILLFILCVFVVPPFLYASLKKLVDPIPLYLLPLLAVVAIVVLAGIRELQLISADNVFAGTVVSFLLLLLVVDFAVITPYPFFAKKLGDASPGMVFVLLAFIGAFLLFWMTAGDIYYGRPMPPFSGPLPLTGWILDGAVSVLGLGDIVYTFGSPVYEVLREAGLYLEVLIIAIVYYWVLSLVPQREPAST